MRSGEVIGSKAAKRNANSASSPVSRLAGFFAAVRLRAWRAPVLRTMLMWNNLYRAKRLGRGGIGCHVRDLLYQGYAGVVALTENGIAAIQVRRGTSVMKNCAPFVSGPAFA